MRLSERVYLVGSGWYGFGLSDDLDCHVYAVDCGGPLALIDAGAGRSIEPILQTMRFDGLDPARLRWLFLTHAHADHAGAAALWREGFGVEVAASVEAGGYLRDGDEEKISLAVAKRGGFYPQDYVFRACPVARFLTEGQTVAVGDLALEVLETPGHCSGMVSFLLIEQGKSWLFTGDTVFHGGKILISNLWDCDVPRYAASVRKLANVEVDGLLPGHLSLALQGGARHIRAANQVFERLAVPASIL